MKRRFLAYVLGVLVAGSTIAADSAPAPTAPPARPKFVDLGAAVCIPCRMMTPILAELSIEYAGQLDVLFIDVWKTPGAGERYGIRLIPTQIFFDAAGRELFRHEGFYAKKEILAKWAELGVKLTPPVDVKARETGQKP